MYHAVDASMIRASVFPLAAKLPPWPNLEGNNSDAVQEWREWITQIWADETTAAAIELAAPLLAEAVRKVLVEDLERPRSVRRVTVSLVRYLLRIQHRATPFGLFAGPAPVRIGHIPSVCWGTQHRAFTRADAVWLNDVITTLENNPEVLRHLSVVADPTCTVRGATVTVPHQPGPDGPTDTTMRRTRAVEAVLALASTPSTVGDIVAKLHSDYPDTSTSVIEAMVRDLVRHRVLLTNLQAPMTCDDALGHLVTQLDAVGVDAGDLRDIHQLLTRHDTASADEQRTIRAQVTTAMTAVSGVVDRHLMVNLRPDGEVVLPADVAHEAERALETIARISPYPNGSPAWQDYRSRFLERYSMGAVVPLRDLTDPDTGLGFPVGYRGTVLPRPVLATTRRDEYLLALAQSAALNNQREVVLTEEDITALSLGEPTQVPAHVELVYTVLSHSLKELEKGRFSLLTAGLSLAAGTTTGRFLTMLDQADRDRMTAVFADLPTLAAEAVRGQVSSPPLRLPTHNVGRAPAVLPHALSVGEHNPQATLDIDDLGVVADSGRLYLVSLSTGQVIEPSVMNAVELSSATHPLVRFVCELHRSHTAILIPFAWGAAARLPCGHGAVWHDTFTERMKMLCLVRHAESIENATKHTGFYENPRPWTGPAAHALSRDVVGLTPRGFLQCLWLRQTLRDLTGPDPAIRTSQYRRALDTATLALPGLPYEVTALLNEQHYGAATYMTKQELYATYPEGTEDRQTRKHLWTPPGADGESLACGVLRRATAFVDDLHTTSAADVVAVTHHIAIIALRAVLERRPVTELVDEARVRKTPNAAVLVYEQVDGLFHARGTAQPDC